MLVDGAGLIRSEAAEGEKCTRLWDGVAEVE